MANLISDAQVNIYFADPEALTSFYKALGLTEKFRFPASGRPDQIELSAGSLTLGFTSKEALARLAGLTAESGPPQTEVVLWCDDTDLLHARALAQGAQEVAPPKVFNGRIRASLVQDPEGNRVKVVSLVPRQPEAQ